MAESRNKVPPAFNYQNKIGSFDQFSGGTIGAIKS